MKTNKCLFAVLGIAIILKLTLFLFVTIHTPESMFQPDSGDYLQTAQTLLSTGAFAKAGADGKLTYEFLRSPGYPIFLVFLNGILRIPLAGILLLQILLVVAAVILTYKTAVAIGCPNALLCAVILLYDPSMNVLSVLLLTESLFLFLMAIFLRLFVGYLKTKKLSLLLFSTLVLAAATYVRPISYYLGFVLGGFIVYSNFGDSLKKGLMHAVVLLVVLYLLLGAWQWRNYRHFGNMSFSGIIGHNYSAYSIFGNPEGCGTGMQKIEYFAKTLPRAFLSFMTGPGTFKYFKLHALTVVGKVFGYFLVVFWLTGFIYGAFRFGKNIYYQFIMLVILYFIAVSVCGVGLLASDRFRAPIMPFIAIISAYGWDRIRLKVSPRTV